MTPPPAAGSHVDDGRRALTPLLLPPYRVPLPAPLLAPIVLLLTAPVSTPVVPLPVPLPLARATAATRTTSMLDPHMGAVPPASTPHYSAPSSQASAAATAVAAAAGTVPATASADVTQAAAPQGVPSRNPRTSTLARGVASPSTVSLGWGGTLASLKGRMPATTEAATPAGVVRQGGLVLPLLL